MKRELRSRWRWWLAMGWLLSASLSGLAALPAAQPEAQDGVLDLRKTDLTRVDVPLTGTWRWTWQRLIGPTDPAVATESVPFPQLWNHSTWRGKPLPAQGYATYALTILLPPGAGALALNLPDTYTAYRLFVNGTELAHNGIPGTNRETTTPYWSSQVKRLPVGSDTLRLLLQIANFHHSKGGPYKAITLGNADRLSRAYNVDRALELFLTGCLFMGGLFFLGLFLFGRRDRAILYFSLFCLIYSYRIIGTDEYALHALFPGLAWVLTIHLEYLSLFLGIATFIVYTRLLYPDDVHPLFSRVLAGICFGFAAVTIVMPPTVFTWLITPFLGLMFAYIGYAFFVYWRAAQRRRPGANYALMSTGLLMVVFFAINLEYFGIASPDNLLLFIGYVGFFFLQSLILSFRFAHTLHRARAQAEEGLRAKSEFLSTMSHEIRTPLNAVIGMTHLLLGDNPRSDQREQLSVLLFSANNLLTIVNDILDFSKIEAGKISFEAIPMELATLARNVVAGYRSLALEKNLDLRLMVEQPFPGPVLGDPTRTAQVLTNLVHNALKFTEKGSVKVRLHVDAATDRDLTLTFEVEDTGIGIAPEKQKLIFEQFTQADSAMTRSFGGTGLGLTICKRILSLQGVELQLRSEPGRGTTFFFTQTFLRAPKTAALVEAAKPVPNPVGKEKPLEGVSVLLVEDTPMNVLAARGILARWGCSVEVATNGQEALDRLDPARHDLVLMDLHMPVMDGYEATRRLRDRGETLPIIALTASLAQEVEEKTRDTGLNDIVVKPFNPNELLRVMQLYLAK